MRRNRWPRGCDGEREVCLPALGPGGGCGNFWKDPGNREREVPVSGALGRRELAHLAVAVAQVRKPQQASLSLDACSKSQLKLMLPL